MRSSLPAIVAKGTLGLFRTNSNDKGPISMSATSTRIILVALAACLPISALQAAEGDQDPGEDRIAIGLGFLDQYAPFNGAPSQTFMIPFLSVKQGAFFLEGLETGIQLDTNLGSVTPSLSLFVAARSPGGQDRQKITVDAGARLSLATKLGTISGEFRHDVTGTFDGSELIARYSYPIAAGRFTITPSVQASWLDRKAANYMYGITAAQRAKMITKQRRVVLPVAPITDDALNLGGDLAMSFRLNQRLTLIATAGATALDKSIHRSAAIEQKWEAQSAIGLTYRF